MKHPIFSGLSLAAFVVLSLGLVACSGVLTDPPAPTGQGFSVSVELSGMEAVAGSETSSRAIGVLDPTDTVTVSAYPIAAAALPYTIPPTAAEVIGTLALVEGVWKGSLDVTGGDMLFQAFAKDVAGNILYFGENRVLIAGDAQQVTITVESRTMNAVNLGTAANFVILAKTSLTNSATSVITGDIGLNSVESAITGFGTFTPGAGEFTTVAEVTGNVYATDYGATTATYLGTAVGDMDLAYTAASGFGPTPVPAANYIELGGGEIGGLILVPGVYKWTTNLDVSSDVTLYGGPDDVWVFQTTGILTVATTKKVLLAGSAKAKNIFWQVDTSVALGTSSHLEGVVLSGTALALGTDATVNGRLLSKTAVTLLSNVVTQPAP